MNKFKISLKSVSNFLSIIKIRKQTLTLEADVPEVFYKTLAKRSILSKKKGKNFFRIKCLISGISIFLG